MSSTTIVTATALVDLGGDDSASRHLSVALDSREAGLNAGRTRYWSSAPPQDAPAFLIWAAGLSISWHAIGGRIVPVATEPTIVTEHSREVLAHLPPGERVLTERLEPPAAALAAWTPDPGSGPVTVVGAERSADGAWVAVRLELPQAAIGPWGTWVSGRMEWRAAARAVRIQPDAAARRVVLCVTGRPIQP